MGNSTTGRHGEGATVYATPNRARFGAAARTFAMAPPHAPMAATPPPFHRRGLRARLEAAARAAGLAVEDAAIIAVRTPLSDLGHHAGRMRRLEQATLEAAGVAPDHLSLGERDALRAEAAAAVAEHAADPIVDLVPRVLAAIARRPAIGTSSGTHAASP